MEGLVETQPRIDVSRKFVRLCDDRLERRSDKSVAMSLAAGQGAGIATEEWQVRSKFLAKGHVRIFSLENWYLRRLWRRHGFVATLEGPLNA
jgi:hypothetical protein